MERRARTVLPNGAAPSRARRYDAGASERAATVGKTARGQRTRDRLVVAARQVFERSGFLHARIVDISEAAGVSHGTFYTYFDSKEAIFKEVADAVELDLLTVASSEALQTATERIRAANRHYIDTYRDNAEILAVVLQVSTFDEEVRNTRVHRHRIFAQSIERSIRRYQQEGFADSSVDPYVASFALGGMVSYFAEQVYLHGIWADLDQAVEELTRLWCNALRNPYEAPTTGSS